MTYRSLTLTIGLLALVACDVEDTQPVTAKPTPAQTSTAAPLAVSKSHETDTDRDILETRILERFHGIWGPWGNCPKNSDGQVTITGTKIIFYESEGKVITTEKRTQGLIVSLEMNAEGETWIREVMLRLSTQDPYGEVLLILPPPDSDRVVRPILFARCPE